MSLQTEVTVLGGLRLTIEFCMQGADPDVGIMSAYCEEWYIVGIAGRDLREGEKTDWIENRLSEREKDRIVEQCEQSAYEQAQDDGY